MGLFMYRTMLQNCRLLRSTWLISMKDCHNPTVACFYRVQKPIQPSLISPSCLLVPGPFLSSIPSFAMLQQNKSDSQANSEQRLESVSTTRKPNTSQPSLWVTEYTICNHFWDLSSYDKYLLFFQYFHLSNNTSHRKYPQLSQIGS